jgi:hypothetical protein
MFTITDTEAATLRAAHDILAGLVRESSDVMNALVSDNEDEVIAAVIAKDDKHPFNRGIDINCDADRAAWGIHKVLGLVTETTDSDDNDAWSDTCDICGEPNH